MNKQTSQSRKRDPDLIHAEVAIKRAAIKARELAQKSGTAIITIKNGKLHEDYPSK